MKRTDKEKLMQFWIDKEKYKLFEEKCSQNGYSHSGWLRAQIEKFIKEDEK
jgi:hypothetical protein